MLYLVQLPLPKPTLFPYTTLFRSLPNTLGEALGFWELLNPAYGMGRQTAAYRGHLLTYHGGDLPGFHSQVSFMPNVKIGVYVMVIRVKSDPLYNFVSTNVF